MKLRYLSLIVVLATIVLSFYHQEYAHSNSTQPDPGHTGAPNETTCNTSNCHSGNNVLTTSSDIVFDATSSLTSGYTPGTTYNIALNFNANAVKKGFELTALTASNLAAGTLALGAGSNANITSLQTSNGRQYIGHKAASATSAWVFKWTAPSTNVGPVSFYIAANAANGDGSNQGDVIHTKLVTVAAAGGCSILLNVNGNRTLCSGTTTLTAAATLTTGAVTYIWSNGTTGASNTITSAGVYSVSVQDANSCSAFTSVTVTAGGNPGVASFTTTVDSSGAHITNTSTGSIISKTWSYGDGVTDTNSNASFTHQYATSGTYTISLIVTDGCGNRSVADTTITYTGSTHTGIANASQHNVLVYPNPVTDNFSISIDGTNENFQLNIYNLAGKVVRSEQGVTGSAINLDRNGLSKGIYIYRVQLHNTTLSGKLIVE